MFANVQGGSTGTAGYRIQDVLPYLAHPQHTHPNGGVTVVLDEVSHETQLHDPRLQEEG
jgi:hypothetical protein